MLTTSRALAFLLVMAPACAEEFFEKQVRPLFASRCAGCHGGKKPMAGLDFSTTEGLRQASGLFSEPSRLIAVLGYEDRVKMPPTGKLPAAELDTLRVWISRGAPLPPAPPQASESGPRRNHWAFQPVAKVEPPPVRRSAWVRSPIDAFILAKLESHRLSPAAPAGKLTLLRRVTYDLTGLPPSLAEIEAFTLDSSPEAYEKVVDRLLASPRYGERWGRHWLDVARYAESTGADEDRVYPFAWRYRDYVVEAFNRDLPYDQFVREQIAGDLLPPPAGEAIHTRGIVATGFLALGPKLLAEVDRTKMLYDVVDEQIDTMSRAFLGLSIACARCHDHKFDPITTRDYYSLASILVSTRQFQRLEGGAAQLLYVPLVDEEIAQKWRRHALREQHLKQESELFIQRENARFLMAHQARVADYMLATRDPERAASLDPSILKKWVAYLNSGKDSRPYLAEWYRDPSPGTAAAYQKRFTDQALSWQAGIERWASEVEEARKNEEEAPMRPRIPAGPDRFFPDVALAGAGPLGIPEKERPQRFAPEPMARYQAAQAELKALEKTRPPEPPLACGVREGKAVTQHVFIRGNPANPGEEVPKRLPAILAGERQAEIRAGSGRRELAEFMGSPANPLTARVMVNRIWQGHFGTGLVATASNFGSMGEKPSHPELLNYLAAELVRRGWSVKAMHRLMVLSNTYQMSSLATPAQQAVDPAGRHYSRFPRRRLAAEEVRDSLLAVSGTIDFSTEGSHDDVREAIPVFMQEKRLGQDPDKSRRRTLYVPLRRSNVPAFLTLFDFGDASTTGDGRGESTIAPQALYLRNSPFLTGRASELAKSLLPLTPKGRVERAYLLIAGRPPSTREIDAALGYVAAFPDVADLTGWTSLCRALFASNLFLYVM